MIPCTVLSLMLKRMATSLMQTLLVAYLRRTESAQVRRSTHRIIAAGLMQPSKYFPEK